ncbi:MAG: 2Fe-2S iron-sulfur cluster-binding protein [Pseudomonadota bacterium]
MTRNEVGIAAPDPAPSTSSIAFTFDGTPLTGAPTQSIAAALVGAGIREMRRTEGGAARGVFCGMGVCQDCLVTVDGMPNRRSCMTALKDGMAVTTQPARAPLTAPPDAPLKAVRRHVDVLVLGGGAGGLSAARSAAEAGAKVLLLDERKRLGGQYYKQPAELGRAPLDTQQGEGRRLIEAALATGVEVIDGAEIWGAFDGLEIMAATDDAAYAIRAGAVIVATGVYERPAMIPGWTLPGVMTVGAAQTFWRSYGTLPGRRVALAGNGPLVAQVALELARGGAEIVALAEAAPVPFSRPAAGLALARAQLALAAKGAGLLAGLARRGIVVSHGTLPRRIEQREDSLAITLETQRSGRSSTRTVEADVFCMNFGFQPQNEILRLLGAEMTFDARFDQLRPSRGPTFETSVAGLYAVGDCCGIGGAPAAVLEGAIAGRAAAGGAGPSADEARRLDRHRAFQDALWTLYAAPIPRLEDVPAEAQVCRCEEVTKAALDEALAVGSTDIGAVKRATRIGMGRCQGRYCGPALAGLMARRSGVDPQNLSFFAPRVPVKPLPIGALVAVEELLDAIEADA